jgi:hypothetical protein
MKKFLIFMMLAFSVVMYASPPSVPEVITEQIQFSPPGEFQTVQEFDLDSPDSYRDRGQEVAFVYLGNFELASYQEYIIDPVAKLEFPELVIDNYLFAFADDMIKPPSNKNLNELLINKQHSNYGYPFTGN